MKIITEQQIEKVLDRLDDSDEWYDQLAAELQEEQPKLVAFLVSEQFELLTVEEQDYMFYLALVIWQTIRQVKGALPTVSEQEIGEAEEANWELLEGVTAKKFRDRMTIFFEQSPQEDLLAFIEDALIEDDDDLVTKEGREPMFVALKTLVDVLTKN